MTDMYTRIQNDEFKAPYIATPERPDVTKIDSKRESAEALANWEAQRKQTRIDNSLAEGKAQERFWQALAEDAGLVGHPKLPVLQRLAWEHGHSSGLTDVYNYYTEFAELLS